MLKLPVENSTSGWLEYIKSSFSGTKTISVLFIVSIVTAIVKILVTLLKNAMGPINDINHGEMC